MGDRGDLYHYTSVDTMHYILESGIMYATNLKYMNDSEEYANGIKEIYQIINRRRKNLISREKLALALEEDVPIYTISFSEARDLLSQWAMYAGDSGVSVKFRFTGEEKYKTNLSDEESAREYIFEDGVNVVPQKVFYCTRQVMSKKQYNIEANAIWNYIQSDMRDVTLKDAEDNLKILWQSKAPLVKHYEFRAEKEYRLVFDKKYWQNGKFRYKIYYRGAKNILKPYLKIECEKGWPVREVMVGPGKDQETAFQCVIHFLNNSNLKINNCNFFQQCEEYLALCELPPSVMEIWENNKKFLENAEDNQYDVFETIKTKMLSKLHLTAPCAVKLRNSVIARNGIIVSKSPIPYVFC